MSRKNRPYKKGEPFRDAIFFVIACEGAVRERQYFEHVPTDTRRLKLVVLAPEPTKNTTKAAAISGSSPKWVLNRLTTFIVENNINVKKTGDQVWMVLDIDRWPIQELIQLTEICKTKQWGIALSNPCFEVWLYLHVKNMAEATTTTCQELKTILSQLELGNRQGYDVKKYLENINFAIERGYQQQDDPLNPIPNPLISRVHLLVEQLLRIV